MPMPVQRQSVTMATEIESAHQCCLKMKQGSKHPADLD